MMMLLENVAITTTIAVLIAPIWFYRKLLFPWLVPKEEETQRSEEISKKPEHKGETPIRRSVLSVDKLIDSTAPEVHTLYDAMQSAFKKFQKEKCMGWRTLEKTIEEEKEVGEEKKEKKKWTFYKKSPYKWITYREVFERIRLQSKGLYALGITPELKPEERRVAIYADTCAEWMMMCQACWSQGITVVTVYANLGQEALVHALKETEMGYIFTTAEQLEMLNNVLSECPSIKSVIYSGKAKDEILKSLRNSIKVMNLEELEDLGKEHSEIEDHPPSKSDLATIMYTSGSSGTPKGVMMTHANILATLGAAKLAIGTSAGIGPGDVYIAFLPLAHILELLVQMVVVVSGVAVGFSSPRTLTDQNMKDCKGDLKELRPTLMPGVPTAWEKVRQGAMSKIKKMNPIVKGLFWTAFYIKKKAIIADQETPILDKLVFNKFKEQIGGRVRLMLSAGAPLSSDVHWFMRICFCHPVVQVYGLTETCGAGTWLPFDHTATERAGSPLPSVEIKLVDAPDMKYFTSENPPRGEIWIRGPSVTQGYFKMEKKTKEVFDEDGWFHTEDIGELHPDGTISIVDRMSNLIKLSHGEYVAVENIESKYKTSEMVEQIMVYGDRSKSFPIAIVVPSKKALKSAVGGSGDFAKLCESDKAKKAVLDSLKKAGSGLKSIEMVKGVYLEPEPWTTENGKLTAAQKLKRKEISEEYKDKIAEIYKKVEASTSE